MSGLPALLGAVALLLVGPARAQQNPSGLVIAGTAKVADRFTPLMPTELWLRDGMLGVRIDVNAKNRLLHVDENDLLDAFERRNVPHQDWQGEHVGKFLHAATLAWNYDHDPALKAKLDRVVSRLLRTQEPDGYLGTYPPERRWTSWDVWVHKYVLLGLLTYDQFTHAASTHPTSHASHGPELSEAALKACRRVGDLLIATFGPGRRDINRAGEHAGLAPDSVLEPIVLLYRATGDARYLAFARYIVRNYDAPGGPALLAALERYRTVLRVGDAKAYEMLSNFNGLLELYRATGERRLLDDMEIAWSDIVRNRLYLTGSASSYETFQDEFHLPGDERYNICETCVTVTWEQMNLELLRLTGDSRYADQIERSVYNHLLAAQKPTGDDWAYYTPLEGHKPYDSATTCCHSSGPRGVALIPAIAFMTSDDGGLVVNLYNAGQVGTRLPSGKAWLMMETDYPAEGRIDLAVMPQRNGQRFPLRLRIPAWAAGATLRVNGGPAKPVAAGAYALVERAWRRGDSVRLDLPMKPRVVIGAHDEDGREAVMWGPVVLALDTARNPNAIPLKGVALSAETATGLHLTRWPGSEDGAPAFRTAGTVGSHTLPLTLVPYADAGQDGKSRFEVWIPRPGHAPAMGASGSLFSGAKMSASRHGNVDGDIADDDFTTFVVTYDGSPAEEDWYAVTRSAPARISRVVFAHGHTFHDGGWFNTYRGAARPRVQVRTTPDGDWLTVALLDTYPDTTATDPAGLQDGQKFEAAFKPVTAFAVRVIGRPATGNNPNQAFSSCAELQAFP